MITDARPMSRVALHHSENRQENIRAVLESNADAILPKIRQAKNIVLKPNLVHNQRQLAVIPGDTAATVIAWLRQHTDASIIVGDASFHDTEDAFTTFGYRNLPDRFPNVRLVDFNRGQTVPGVLFHTGMREHPVRVAKTVAESDFRLSLAPMKTHNHFILSLGIKNWSVGIIVAPRFGGTRTWQRWPHFHAQGYRVSHASVIRILKDFPTDLTILDGWEGMEGNGPTGGEAVPLHVALAGTDPVAVDATAARIMGFNPEDIGYLVFGQEEGLGTFQDIELIGNASLENVRRKFKLHTTYRQQLGWKGESEKRWGSLWPHVLR